jgi:hypothetical protein
MELLSGWQKELTYHDWIQTGLCSSLTEEQSLQVIELFDNCRPYYIQHFEDYKNDKTNKSKFILPIIRKIYDELIITRPALSDDKIKLLIYLLIDTDQVCNELDLYYSILKKIKIFKNLDAEAQFVQLFSTNFVWGIIKMMKKKKIFTNELEKQLVKLQRDKKISKILP